jgi:hypothetical protein
MVRPMRWVRWVGLGYGLVVALAATRARAVEPESAPPTYALSWVRAEGAEDCPNGRVLVAEIERRVARHVFDPAAERAFEVEVTRFGQTYRSDVFVRDATGGVLGHRSLQSDEPSCSALVSATALAIALVIDPEAAARPPAPTESAAAFEPPPAPPTTPPLLRERVSSCPPAPACPLRPMVAPRPDFVELSLRGELSAGLVPATSPGVELSFGARRWRRWGFALSAAYAASKNVSRGTGSLDLSLTRGSALVTFQPLHESTVGLVLGAGAALGALHLAVREPVPVTHPGDFWFVAFQAEAELQLYLTNTLFVDLGGDVFAPIVRQEFLVRRQTEAVWRQPVLAGRGFFGVGVMFP